MQLSVTSAPGSPAVVAVTGELDVANSAELRQFLHARLDDGTAALTVDLTGVAFLDSTTLSVFVGVHKRLHEERGSGLTLVVPHERLLRIFRLTALDRLFTIIDALPGPATA
ncbi:STAS domain-containing protein [Dactylosporangium sp. NPDC000521]|uniref:STAS domain-containing protein n=1 Tax=Dactylosporangium sp. NPDC000521 TaxID=3363975 RepID=UPI0036A07087